MLNRKRIGKEELKEIINQEAQFVDPQNAGQVVPQPTAIDANNYRPPYMNASYAAYNAQGAPSLVSATQEQLFTMDAQLKTLVQGIDNDIGQRRVSLEQNPMMMDQWNYLRKIAYALYNDNQNLMMIHQNIAPTDPMMTFQTQQMMYQCGDNYLPYGQIAYVMPQDVNRIGQYPMQ